MRPVFDKPADEEDERCPDFFVVDADTFVDAAEAGRCDFDAEDGDA